MFAFSSGSLPAGTVFEQGAVRLHRQRSSYSKFVTRAIAALLPKRHLFISFAPRFPPSHLSLSLWLSGSAGRGTRPFSPGRKLLAWHFLRVKSSFPGLWNARQTLGEPVELHNRVFRGDNGGTCKYFAWRKAQTRGNDSGHPSFAVRILF